MIEVHPPHEDVHTWRQFCIHIAAITIGLLIAISLEQTVVYFHHRHQLQEARRELAVELESNRRSPDGNLTPRDIEELITATSEVQAKVAYSTLLLRLEENALQKKTEEISKIQQKFQH